MLVNSLRFVSTRAKSSVHGSCWCNRAVRLHLSSDLPTSRGTSSLCNGQMEVNKMLRPRTHPTFPGIPGARLNCRHVGPCRGCSASADNLRSLNQVSAPLFHALASAPPRTPCIGTFRAGAGTHCVASSSLRRLPPLRQPPPVSGACGCCCCQLALSHQVQHSACCLPLPSRRPPRRPPLHGLPPRRPWPLSRPLAVFHNCRKSSAVRTRGQAHGKGG